MKLVDLEKRVKILENIVETLKKRVDELEWENEATNSYIRIQEEEASEKCYELSP